MPQHRHTRHTLACIDGKTGLLVCPPSQSRRSDLRGYHTLEAAARAFARAIGAYGSPGGWIYSPAGRPIAQGWFAYGRQLVDRGHVVRRTTGTGEEVYTPRLPRAEGHEPAVPARGHATACIMSKEHGHAVTGHGDATRHGMPIVHGLARAVRLAKTISGNHPSWTVTVYENPTGSCAEHVPIRSYRNGKGI